MSPNRIILGILLSMVPLFMLGETIEEYRELLPKAKGEERISVLGNIFKLALEEGDLSQQLQSIDELIAETRHQQNKKEEADALIQRLVLFYNNDLNDSIYKYGPDDLEDIRESKKWDYYYEGWSILVNTYVYDGKVTTGLQEAEKMHKDAMERKHDNGTALAYYAMGNAYVNMGVMEKAGECYQKGIDLMMQKSPLSPQLSELFSSLSEVYDRIGDYQKLNRLTVQWRRFLDKFFKERDLDPDDPAYMTMWAYFYIGCAQADLGLERLEHAREMLELGRERIPSEDDYIFRTWLFYRARLGILDEKYTEALSYNDKQMLMFDGVTETADYLRTLEQRATIMSTLRRYREAADLFGRMYVINDSVNGFETKKQLAEMNTILHVDDIKMQEERARSRQQLLSFIALATLVVVGLVIFIYFRQRAAKRLEKAHSELEDTHQQLLTAYDQLEETTAAKERIESDLRIARDIQMSMVPRTFPERSDLDIYASMTPAKEVGGDLYGYHLVDDKLYFVLGDVSGKGVPASLFMAQATRLFRTLAGQKMMPAEIANHINDALSGEDNERSMFVTMFIGLVDITTGHLDFCNAGHNPPILVGDGTAEFIDMIPNAPIGLWPEMEFEGEEIADITNHPFFVYSDGLNEAENRQQEQFSDERLLEILQTRPFESSEKTIEMLREEVEKHRDGAEPNDDLTMLCVKIIKDNQ